jgi:sulfur-oxidizing protein SoxA
MSGAWCGRGWWLAAGVGWLVTALTPAAGQVVAERPALPRPGVAFQTAETQALQADEAANPGMLWVDQGAGLWTQPPRAQAPTCATCHGAAEAAMRGVAARLPRVAAEGEVVTLEVQIDQCRERQGATALPAESNERLALAAYVAYQSRGLPRQLDPTVPSSSAFSRARALFHQRQGQLNLACAHCHVDLEGRRLRGDTISQAQTQGWPAYRLEWQAMGSLQRRLRACSLGVRAEVLPFGAPEYLALELYLAWRGEGLPMESPGIRR